MPEQDVRGKSLLDLLWEQMDQFVDAVQEPVNQDEFENAKGRAHGMAVAIALVTNPYHPDVDTIKSEAMERWAERGDLVESVRTRNERSTEEHLAELEQRRKERRARRQARRAARNG